MPKVFVLQQIANKLRIAVDDLLRPISQQEAVTISAVAIADSLGDIEPPSAQKNPGVFHERFHELATVSGIQHVSEALQLKDVPKEELVRLFEHIVSVTNRAPAELKKYYVVIRGAVIREIGRKFKLK